MTLHWTVADIHGAEHQENVRWRRIRIFPMMKQVCFKDQAVAGFKGILLIVDCVSNVTFNAIEKFASGMYDRIFPAVRDGIKSHN